MKKFLIISGFCCLLLFILPPSAFAEFRIGEKFGFGTMTSLGAITSNLVLPVFSLAAVLVIIYFLVGAFKYLASGGDKEALAGSRNMIIHAIIGFIILMFAFLILQFLLYSLLNVKDSFIN